MSGISTRALWQAGSARGSAAKSARGWVSSPGDEDETHQIHFSAGLGGFVRIVAAVRGLPC